MKIRAAKLRSGFTLIEIMIATIMIGLAVASMLASNGAYSKANSAGLAISQGQFLVDQIREMTAMVDVIDPESGTITFGAEESSLSNYDDLDDFDGASYNPPIDINRDQLTDYAAYTQKITVENVSLANLQTVVADHSTDMVRVSVVVTLAGKNVASSSWIRARID